MVKVPITRLGYERLCWRLEYLKRFTRWEVARDLRAAREFGLTSRNLQWRTAREKQFFVDRRIEELETQLQTCEVVICTSGQSGRAGFGLFVRVDLAPLGRSSTFQLVGPFESDVSAGRLSIASPVGRRLLGRRIGEEVTVRTPSGDRTYRIREVFSAGADYFDHHPPTAWSVPDQP